MPSKKIINKIVDIVQDLLKANKGEEKKENDIQTEYISNDNSELC